MWTIFLNVDYNSTDNRIKNNVNKNNLGWKYWKKIMIKIFF